MSDCCNVPDNLYVLESLPNGLVIRKCRECGRRHFELTVDPGVYEFKGKSL